MLLAFFIVAETAVDWTVPNLLYGVPNGFVYAYAGWAWWAYTVSLFFILVPTVAIIAGYAMYMDHHSPRIVAATVATILVPNFTNVEDILWFRLFVFPYTPLDPYLAYIPNWLYWLDDSLGGLLGKLLGGPGATNTSIALMSCIGIGIVLLLWANAMHLNRAMFITFVLWVLFSFGYDYSVIVIYPWLIRITVLSIIMVVWALYLLLRKEHLVIRGKGIL
jgi:hypothetical protein